jgi:hypothetical protein
MKEQRDTPRPTMSDEEMVKDYPRLAREYTLLHQDYREAIRKPLNIPDVSQQRELLIEAFDLINIHDGDREKITKLVDITLKSINCG